MTSGLASPIWVSHRASRRDAGSDSDSLQVFPAEVRLSRHVLMICLCPRGPGCPPITQLTQDNRSRPKCLSKGKSLPFFPRSQRGQTGECVPVLPARIVFLRLPVSLRPREHAACPLSAPYLGPDRPLTDQCTRHAQENTPLPLFTGEAEESPCYAPAWGWCRNRSTRAASTGDSDTSPSSGRRQVGEINSWQ